MTLSRYETKYFNWLCDLVYDRKSKNSYNKLLRYLYEREFTWVIPMDENRALDGIALRDDFIDIYPYAENLDDKPCSMLEMMVALANRCETNIMADDSYGDRTGEWFWNMILSLGLTGMNDSRFNKTIVEKIIFCFETRQYDYNGSGGLFTVTNPFRDMRDVEIWYQMSMYLGEVLE